MLFIDQKHKLPTNNSLYTNKLSNDYDEIFTMIGNSFTYVFDNAISYFLQDNVDTMNNRFFRTNGVESLTIQEGIFCKMNRIDLKSITKFAICKNIRIFLYKGSHDGPEEGGVFKSSSFNKDKEEVTNMISIFIDESRLNEKYAGNKKYPEVFLFTLIMKYIDIMLTIHADLKFTLPGIISIEDSTSSYYVLYLYIKTFMMLLMSTTECNQDEVEGIVANALLYDPSNTLTFDSWHIDGMITEMSLIDDYTYQKPSKEKFADAFDKIHRFATKSLNDSYYMEPDDDLLTLCATLYDLVEEYQSLHY